MSFFKRHGSVYCSVLLAVITVTALGINLFFAIPAIRTAAGPDPVIMIDAGHGGEDGGAVSASGVRECDLNLQIAFRVDAMLRLMGQNSCMIRTEDRSLHGEDAVTIAQKKASDLKYRADTVNSMGNALLISIHQNMFEDERYDGAQVFYAPTVGSMEFAEMLQERLRVLDPDNRRQVKTSESVYLMTHITCPAVLVECGFLSNPAECGKLCDREYQKQLAMVISVETIEYLGKVITNEV